MNNRINVTKSDLKRMREEEGRTVPEIAKHYNLSISQTTKMLKAAGLGKRVNVVKFNLIDDINQENNEGGK